MIAALSNKTGIVISGAQNKKAYNKEYHLLKRDEILERHRQYRQQNADRIREYGRRHYWENRDYYLQHASQYMKAHPEKAISYVAKRRMLSYHNGEYEVIDRNKVFERDQGVCWICELPISDKWELDHKIPLSRGGHHTYTNVAASHRSLHCNKAANN